ncbi:hypothetical protein [Cellulosimicrobium cellulans]|uniref:hypothetical protein n=1 Tax=Cellulosimicrobium cellulans TaxID=1710 RepID=UPI0024060618|nr:hypothetical protein [Cellulosimicrobium cellulans]MDF9878703.1 hypothetical protein [Cellulosimicrobium cellulans]
MDANTIAAVVAAVVAAVGAVAAAVAAVASLPFTRRAANAASDQTALQAEIAREQAQPYVWADIQPDAKQGTLLQVVVGNSGPTVASNVRVTIDPPLPVADQFPGRVEVAQRRLASGIRSLAPGRRIEWTAGRGFDVLAKDAPQVHTLRVTADGPHGPIAPLEFEVDLSDWRESRDSPDGSLHLVRNAVQDLTKELKALHQSLDRDAERRAPAPIRSVDATTRADGFTREVPTGEN